MSSNLPISSKYRNVPAAPVSEAEREDLAARLNEEYAKGKIDPEDYQTLLDTVFSARTMGELLPVAEVLPVKATHDQPAIVSQQINVAPGELAPSTRGNALSLGLMAAGGAAVVAIIAVILLLVLL